MLIFCDFFLMLSPYKMPNNFNLDDSLYQYLSKPLFFQRVLFNDAIVVQVAHELRN